MNSFHFRLAQLLLGIVLVALGGCGLWYLSVHTFEVHEMWMSFWIRAISCCFIGGGLLAPFNHLRMGLLLGMIVGWLSFAGHLYH